VITLGTPFMGKKVSEHFMKELEKYSKIMK